MSRSSSARTLPVISIAAIAVLVGAQLTPLPVLADNGGAQGSDAHAFPTFTASLAATDVLANQPVDLTVTASDPSWHEGTQIAVDGAHVSPGAVPGSAWHNGAARISILVSGPLGAHSLTVRHGNSAASAPFAFTLGFGPLDHLVVSGPATVPAGSTTTYAIYGYDASGNDVTNVTSDITHKTVDFTAADSPLGAVQDFCYTETSVSPSVTGCAHPILTSGPLASIAITCPALPASACPSPLVTTPATSTPLGVVATDAFGNTFGFPATLGATRGTIDAATTSYVAPHAAGADTITASAAGVPDATLPVTVLPGPLATITVTGPASLVQGSTASYHLAGFDAFGNAVALDQSTLSFTASELGTQHVCYTQAGVTGCETVIVTAPEQPHTVITTGASGAASVTTYTITYASVAPGDVVQVVGSSGSTSVPQLSFANFHIRNGASDVTFEIQVQTVDLASLPPEVDPTSLAAELQSGDGSAILFINVYAFEGGVQLTSAQLNDLIESVDLEFTVPPGLLAGLDAPSFLEYSGGSLYAGGLTATLVSSAPVPTYDATFTHFSSFAFVARHPTVVPVSTGGSGGGSGGSGGSSASNTPVLTSVVVTGPATLRVGQTATYNASGRDQFGNAYRLSASTFSWTAPTVVPASGVAEACYQETTSRGPIVGCQDVTILADEPTQGTCSVADQVFAGTPVVVTCQFFDENGNLYSTETFTITAPSKPGLFTVCKTENGVRACAPYTVLLGPPNGVVITPGNASVHVGGKVSFVGTDYDGQGYPIPNATLTWAATCGSVEADGSYVAPTVAGTCYVKATNPLGNSAQAAVLVTAGDAVALQIVGPDFIVAGSPVQFTAVGIDAFGNKFDEGQAGKFTVTANEKVGPQQVCDTIGNATGCKTVTVVPGPIANVQLSSPDSYDAANATYVTTYPAPIVFSVAASDKFGNAIDVPTEVKTFSWTPTDPGHLPPGQYDTQQACFSLEGSASSCVNVRVYPSSSLGPSGCKPDETQKLVNTTSGPVSECLKTQDLGPSGQWWEWLAGFAVLTAILAGAVGLRTNWFRKKP
jgi:hypothetical protein